MWCRSLTSSENVTPGGTGVSHLHKVLWVRLCASLRTILPNAWCTNCAKLQLESQKGRSARRKTAFLAPIKVKGTISRLKMQACLAGRGERRKQNHKPAKLALHWHKAEFKLSVEVNKVLGSRFCFSLEPCPSCCPQGWSLTGLVTRVVTQHPWEEPSCSCPGPSSVLWLPPLTTAHTNPQVPRAGREINSFIYTFYPCKVAPRFHLNAFPDQLPCCLGWLHQKPLEVGKIHENYFQNNLKLKKKGPLKLTH